MSDVIRDKTNAEVAAALRSAAGDERLAAGARHLHATAAFRIEALMSRLAAAEQENAALREELRLREESQIPVIPRAAHARLVAAEQTLASLREAIADELNRAMADHGPGVVTEPLARLHFDAASHDASEAGSREEERRDG